MPHSQAGAQLKSSAAVATKCLLYLSAQAPSPLTDASFIVRRRHTGFPRVMPRHTSSITTPISAPRPTPALRIAARAATFGPLAGRSLDRCHLAEPLSGPTFLLSNRVHQ